MLSLLLIVFLLCCFDIISSTGLKPILDVEVVHPKTKLHFGAWGSYDLCPHTEVDGFTLRYDLAEHGYHPMSGEEPRGFSVAVAGIHLLCRGTSKIAKSKELGSVSFRKNEARCLENGYVVGVAVQYMPMVYPWDNKIVVGGFEKENNLGITDLVMLCSTGEEIKSDKKGRPKPPKDVDLTWVPKKGVLKCPKGTAICGLRTRVDGDVGVVDAVFICCQLEDLRQH